MRRTVSSCPAICSPIRKKVALAPRSARPSSSCSVVSGHGPSSKVSATYFSGTAAGSAAEAGRLSSERGASASSGTASIHSSARRFFLVIPSPPRRSLCVRRRAYPCGTGRGSFFSLRCTAACNRGRFAPQGRQAFPTMRQRSIKSPFVWLRDLPYKRTFYLRCYA